MKIKSLFLVSAMAIAPMANSMEQRNPVFTPNVLQTFELVRGAIIAKARSVGKSVPNDYLATSCLHIFTKAIKQAHAANLTQDERTQFSTLISNIMTAKPTVKELPALVNMVMGIHVLLTKIIGDEAAQCAIVQEAFKDVDPEYASQQQIAKFITTAVAVQKNPVVTTNATTSTTTISAQPEKKNVPNVVESTPKKPVVTNTTRSTSTALSYYEHASLELARSLQQQEMPSVHDDEELARAIGLSLQNEHSSMYDDEQLARRLATEQSHPNRITQPVRPTTTDEDLELELALALSRTE